jgi:hypothetical protein
MAEKRGLSRVVLKIVGAYKYNVFGEDEADAFKQTTTDFSDGIRGPDTKKKVA